VKIDQGIYKGSFSGGPEYENLAALGAGTAILDIETVLKANELCNLLGLDTISTGSVIQWAMETFEKGLIGKNELGDIEPRFGNGDVLIPLIEMISQRQGFGNVLAEGVKRASEIVGGDSWKWAVHGKGLEQSRVDTRTSKAYALAFAVNPRGCDHLHTEPAAEYGSTPEAVAVIKKITGDARYATSLITEKRAEIVRWHEDVYTLSDSLGFCAFSTTYAYAVNPENIAELFSYATGRDWSAERLMLIGRRILTLEKCFNVRLGLTRKDDVLPWRVVNDPTPEGKVAGMRNSQEELEQMKDEYYRLHNWDLRSGSPTQEVLKELDLLEETSDLNYNRRK
jgi:aldehyde:ferredoxin oxidoreductase